MLALHLTPHYNSYMAKNTYIHLLVISEKEPLSFVRALDKKKYKIYVLGLGRQCIATSRRCSKYFSYKQDDILSNNLTSMINEICEKYNIDLIIPLGIANTIYLARIRQTLISPSLPSLSPSNLSAFHDKWMFSRLLKRKDILFPKTLLIQNPSNLKTSKMKIPFLVKPLSEEGGRGIIKIRTKADLKILLKKISTHSFPCIIQEYIHGTDVAIGFFARQGVILAWEIHIIRKLGSLEFTHDTKVLSLGKKLARCLNYTGMGNFDMKIDDKGKIYVLECNPRIWTSASAAMIEGIDFIDVGLRQTNKIRKGEAQATYVIPQQIVAQMIKHPLSVATLSATSRKDFFNILSDPLPYSLVLLQRISHRVMD